MTRDEVIKGLECCTATADCKGCPYDRDDVECVDVLMREAIALLKAESVVRCDECEHWEPNNADEGDYSGRCRNNWGPCQNQQTDGTWFCEDGVRMEVDT